MEMGMEMKKPETELMLFQMIRLNGKILMMMEWEIMQMTSHLIQLK